jgi:hypothetical protein
MKKKTTITHNTITYGEDKEPDNRKKLNTLLSSCPIPEKEFLSNLGLFLTPQTLSRILFMDFLYRRALEVQGIMVEFGCRWGQNLVLWTSLRGIYEPFNRLRKIVGFDTFEGFLQASEADGKHPAVVPHNYGVTPNYENYLDTVLIQQELESPLSYMKKFELVRGDVSATVPDYFVQHPESIISLAYFDMDLYEPTLSCLHAIRDRITRGSVLGFDELNEHAFPGETLAVKEALGLRNYSIKRYPNYVCGSYIIID